MWCENDAKWLYRLSASHAWESGLPLARADVDRCFLALLEESGFRARGLYSVAVRAFGRLSQAIKRRVRATRGTAIPL